MKMNSKLFLVVACLLSISLSPYNNIKPSMAIDVTMFRRQSVHGITNLVEGTNGVALADFNKDGWIDILTTNSPRTAKGKKGSSTVRMFLNKGNGGYEINECWVMNQSQFLSEGQLAPQIPNVVDFNKDGFLDIFITRQRGGINNLNVVGNSLYLSQGKFDLFTDVSVQMGIQNKDAYNRASSITDVNGDGWLDIAVGADNIGNPDLAGKPESRLYLFKPNGSNFEDGTFVDISNTELAPGFGGDFTCDHDKDKGGGPDINLVDLDNDGDFDLIQSYHNDMLNTKPDNPCASAHFKFGVFVWKNLLKETGTFKMEPVTDNGLAEWGKLNYDPATQKAIIVRDAVRLPYLSFGDINNDNFQDVLAIGPSFLSSQIELQKTRGKLWINDHFFKFHDITKQSNLDTLTWTTKQWYEFQGWQADYPKNFTDQMIYGADAVFGDFNNDTYLDFIACDRREPMGTSFKPRNVLYLNNGDSTFTPKPETFSGIDANSICAETADLNNDGLLDLFFAADPENTALPGQKEDRYQDKVFMNQGSGFQNNHWLKIKLDSLTDAEIMGARIEFLDQKNISLICSRVVSSSHSYKSSSPMEVHAGLGKFEQVMVRVILPDGREFTFGNIETNQYLSLNLTSKQVKVIFQKKEAGPKKPNIILILTDDLDEKLGTMSYTPKLDKYIKQEGVLWEDFFVSDTLCCPSRSTIARGQFVHNHGVLTNGLPGGGFDTFYARGNEDSTFATWLQEVGYETGFFGKYLNGYPFKDDPLHIPPGWSSWISPSGGNPYTDFNYIMNQNGKAVVHGSKPSDYMTDVIRDHSIDFIKQAKTSNKSFMVYLSPYVPHSPATPAPRHDDLFPELKTPRIRSFNEEDISDKPSSFQNRKQLTEKQIEEMDKFYRKRIQSMQAIDDMVEKLVQTLQELGELENTYIFFTGDNGFHMGQHRLAAGKGTAYEEDISVPLYVRGPGIPKNQTITGYLGGNTDFASTFAEIAGAVEPPFVDGRSLLPILQGAKPHWRKVFFIEFYPFARGRGTKPESLKNVESVLEPLDLDETMGLADNFSYIALRLPGEKYIEYKNGEKEYYDLIKDPYEMDNTIKTLSASKMKELSEWVNALHQAKGAELRKLEENDIEYNFNETDFTVDDIKIGSNGFAYHDIEINQKDGSAVFLDENLTMWVGNMDPQNGKFLSTHGRDYQITKGVSKWSVYSNGPEWGEDKTGSSIFYVKDNSQGFGQIWRAEPPWNQPVNSQITDHSSLHHWLCEPSTDKDLDHARVIVYQGKPGTANNKTVWLDESNPAVIHLIDNKATLSRFAFGSSLITLANKGQRTERPSQVMLFNSVTNQSNWITNDDGNKIDPWLWKAPEFNNELLLCVNIDQSCLGIYRDHEKNGSPWKRIATLTLPPDLSNQKLKSIEPINGGSGAFGHSYFTVQAGLDESDDTSIWLFGYNSNGNHLIQRLDDGGIT